MISKTITYTDYEGQQRTETFWFNLTKAELMMMNMSATGGMQKMLERIVATEDTKKISEIFRDIILSAYGVKSDDGRRFIKSPELSADFEQTEAYSELFMELLLDSTAAAAFMNGAMPQGLADAAQEAPASGGIPPIVGLPSSERPVPPHLRK